MRFFFIVVCMYIESMYLLCTYVMNETLTQIATFTLINVKAGITATLLMHAGVLGSDVLG